MGIGGKVSGNVDQQIIAALGELDLIRKELVDGTYGKSSFPTREEALLRVRADITQAMVTLNYGLKTMGIGEYKIKQ